MSEKRRMILCSSLEKIFPDTDTVETEISAYSVFKNEKTSFQFAVEAKRGERVSFSVVSPIQDALRFFYVKMIPAGTNAPKNADDYYIAKDKTEYPDLLLPLCENAFSAEYDGMNTVWVEIQANTVLPVGKHDINITVSVSDTEIPLSLTVEVLDASLPKQDLVFTNWFHTDCLAEYYGVPVFSDEYWRITENFLHRAAAYGMNCVLTPLFTPPLDTKIGGERPTVQLVDVTVTGKGRYSFGFDNLEKWLSMCDRCGIEYYEMSHLFTQWGARHAPKIMAQKDGGTVQIFGWNTRAAGKPYKRFLEQFSKAILAFIDEKGIREKCFFHISDEPNKGMLRSYKKASKIVHKYFTNVRIIDALSDFKLYEKGLVETPIPANNHIEPFIGKVPELWTYYCCAQGNKYVSNRFFAMPSARNRILGAQLFKFDVKGFLHWGYNFYFLQYSKGLIDPYKVTDAGGAFYSGDSFVVYPAKDGTPYNSLRLNVFYDAFQDMLALKLLESKIGKEQTLAVLEKDLEKPITFSEYPHGAKWILETRERVNRAIINAK